MKKEIDIFRKRNNLDGNDGDILSQYYRKDGRFDPRNAPNVLKYIITRNPKRIMHRKYYQSVNTMMIYIPNDKAQDISWMHVHLRSMEGFNSTIHHGIE